MNEVSNTDSAVADPGFLKGGVANSSVYRKLHATKEWEGVEGMGKGSGGLPRSPLESANAVDVMYQFFIQHVVSHIRRITLSY